MKKISNNFLVTLVFIVAFGKLYSQEIKDSVFVAIEKPKVTTTPIGDLKIKFNNDGSKYLKFGFWNQVLLRAIENNPGTAVNGIPQETTYDVGVRRMRITATAQLSPRYLLFVQMGMNNQSFIAGGGKGTGAYGAGKKATLFFHDAYNEFTVIPTIDSESKKVNDFSLYIGAGLHSWSGVSRLTNASSSKMLTADLPVFNFSTIEISDQFGRQMGIFAHGEYKKLGYRVNLNKPFATNLVPAVGAGALDNNKSGKLSYAGYFDYQFFDTEKRITSFFAGTYLGEKKILNVGAGFYSTKDGTITQSSTGVFESHDINILGLDVFAELPVGPKDKKMSFSIYSVLYDYDFGKNYIRTTGTMNPGTADPAFIGTVAKEGFGNAKYLLGTGKIWYTQTGFLLPKFSENIRIQPFATYSLKKLEALSQSGNYYDLGTNLFLEGHNAKISFQYSSRPLYDGLTNTVFKRAGEFLACIQICL
ncbi:porin [Flavobacterium branchiarum]|uniref:Porin n=1 Tax=Flavobacterium branchiarum TaxID=1114870 RepID=A0ABV5FH48_9FLAO|nr:porin [Flavobacterium branchiarum]MDN3671748.1 porin [Flavobacterium branchiarum]